MIPAVRNQIYNLGTAKTLGVIVCSLDLNSDTYSGNWAANKTYAIGDVVEFTPDNSSPDFYKCKVAHTSSYNLNPTDTTKWESATKSGYIVLSNGLKIQWGAISVTNGNISEQLFYTNFSSATSYSITTQMSRNDGSTPQGFVSVKYHKTNAFQVQIVRSTDYMYPSTIQYFAIGY